MHKDPNIIIVLIASNNTWAFLYNLSIFAYLYFMKTNLQTFVKKNNKKIECLDGWDTVSIAHN